MAQQTDPNQDNTDPATATAGATSGSPLASATLGGGAPSTTLAGGTDSTRFPGFQSNGAGTSNNQTPLAAATAPPPAAPDPTQTPGYLAAMSSGQHSKNGLSDNLPFASVFGQSNASPIQDIYGAITHGVPVKDEWWAKAGFGPGGALLPSNPTGATPGPSSAFSVGIKQLFSPFGG